MYLPVVEIYSMDFEVCVVSRARSLWLCVFYIYEPVCVVRTAGRNFVSLRDLHLYRNVILYMYIIIIYVYKYVARGALFLRRRSGLHPLW